MKLRGYVSEIFNIVFEKSDIDFWTNSKTLVYTKNQYKHLRISDLSPPNSLLNLINSLQNKTEWSGLLIIIILFLLIYFIIITFYKDI